jgi:sulfatase modifying factor 1
MLSLAWILFVAQLVAGPPSRAAEGADALDRMAIVGPGTYRPLFPTSPAEREIAVPAFRLDRMPVTNADYLAFVNRHPEWRRDRVAALFADEHYLDRWQAPDALGPAVDPEQPVVDVSWFAARAYCAARGLRLPTEAQWELAAAASATKADASGDAAWKAMLLELETRPMPAKLPRVGQTPPNYWGVRDLHGLVWEWVLDFDAAALAAGDGSDVLQFCGASARASGDKTDFVAFQRFALRSALRARYTTHDLGFRCAGPGPGGTS